MRLVSEWSEYMCMRALWRWRHRDKAFFSAQTIKQRRVKFSSAVNRCVNMRMKKKVCEKIRNNSTNNKKKE